jgi:hypothetical protein
MEVTGLESQASRDRAFLRTFDRGTKTAAEILEGKAFPHGRNAFSYSG